MTCFKKRPKIGLAVSGGIDSCYLMYKYAGHKDKADYIVLTVNHGLRAESAYEVLWVQEQAKKLGLETVILNIITDKPHTRIQEFARNARYHLLAQTAKQLELDYIYLGHHADDQAETILSRLNHQSGYAGLCGMNDMFYYDDICFFRPLLDLSRQEILHSMNHKDFLHDPSNDNPKYERVRNRQFLAQNPEIKQKLLNIAHKARLLYYPVYLQRNAFLLDYALLSPYGYCHINRQLFDQQDELLQQEILKYAIKYVTGNFYIKSIPALNGKNFTSSSAEICFSKEFIKIYRENRNITDYDSKRFVKTNSGCHKDDKNIPHKAKQTLPSGYFTYKPQSLSYFVAYLCILPSLYP